MGRRNTEGVGRRNAHGEGDGEMNRGDEENHKEGGTEIGEMHNFDAWTGRMDTDTPTRCSYRGGAHLEIENDLIFICFPL